MGYNPDKILMRSELDNVTSDVSDYVNLNLPRQIIICGSKGCGKIPSLMSMAMKESKSIPYYYVNARENPTSIKIYRTMTRISSRGHDIDEVKRRFDSLLSGKSIVILDEVDFLQDYDILYHITRHTKANLILLTQKVYWYKDMNN
ncbi:hypothetical protein ACNF42_06785 [Cuniculiplasma sp. SKW3]|uniref:hypothetical protein n=1 Tax=Cuniculiplasma sp. SKW3 TaxID=3400170 RepID=UPI003FD5D2B6